MDAQVLCEYHITIAQITSDTNINHKPNIVMEGMNIITTLHACDYFDTSPNFPTW